MAGKDNKNIYDIAKEAGVSIATVSRVLAGGEKVRPSTRQKVLQVMENANYTPNAFAQGLGLGSMKMVGLLCTDVTDLYYAKAVSVLERSLRGEGFDTLLHCTGDEYADKKHFMDLLLAKHVDAIVLIGSTFQEKEDNSHIAAVAAQLPVVIINGQVDCAGAYSVLCNERSAMRANVDRMCQKGIRKLVYLTCSPTFSSAQKLEGLRQGMAQNGLADKDVQIVECGKSLEGAQRAMEALLDTGQRPRGILASEDMMAVGACKAFVARGLKVPPAIGFNNSLLAQCATPSLSSIDNMVEVLCTNAVRVLGEVLAGQKGSPRITVDGLLVERDSFAAE